MTAEPLRCFARSKSDPRRVCRGRLADAIPDTVTLVAGYHPEPGCTVLQCRKCGRYWTARPAKAA